MVTTDGQTPEMQAAWKPLMSQRPPAKPEAWQRWSGPRPLGPAGDCSAPFNLPHVIGSRSRTRKSLLHRAFIRPLCFSTTNGSAQLFRDQNPWASLQLLPDFPSTHIPGTVKLWESLRQSRRISQGLRLRLGRHALLTSLICACLFNGHHLLFSLS